MEHGEQKPLARFQTQAIPADMRTGQSSRKCVLGWRCRRYRRCMYEEYRYSRGRGDNGKLRVSPRRDDTLRWIDRRRRRPCRMAQWRAIKWRRLDYMQTDRLARRPVTIVPSTARAITGCAVAQHCCKGDQPFQRENPKFDTTYIPNDLIFPNQNLHRWLRPAYLLMCKI